LTHSGTESEVVGGQPFLQLVGIQSRLGSTAQQKKPQKWAVIGVNFDPTGNWIKSGGWI